MSLSTFKVEQNKILRLYIEGDMDRSDEVYEALEKEYGKGNFRVTRTGPKNVEATLEEGDMFPKVDTKTFVIHVDVYVDEL